MAPTRPPKLYKYRVLNAYTLAMLTDAELYYSNPRNFNDPLDCDPSLHLDLDTDDLEKLCASCLEFGKPPLTGVSDSLAKIKEKKAQADLLADDLGISERDKRSHYRWLLGEEIRRFIDGQMGAQGVLSLSEQWDCPLMWSHYGDEHRGVCIEFDVGSSRPHLLDRVDYESPRSIPASDVEKWLVKGSDAARERVRQRYFFAKANRWQYEKEWRDIAPKHGNTAAAFKTTGVYFGLRCPPSVRTTIVKLLRDTGDGMEFFSVKAEKDSFRLVRRRIEPAEADVRMSPVFAFDQFDDLLGQS